MDCDDVINVFRAALLRAHGASTRTDAEWTLAKADIVNVVVDGGDDREGTSIGLPCLPKEIEHIMCSIIFSSVTKSTDCIVGTGLSPSLPIWAFADITVELQIEANVAVLFLMARPFELEFLIDFFHKLIEQKNINSTRCSWCLFISSWLESPTVLQTEYLQPILSVIVSQADDVLDASSRLKLLKALSSLITYVSSSEEITNWVPIRIQAHKETERKLDYRKLYPLRASWNSTQELPVGVNTFTIDQPDVDVDSAESNEQVIESVIQTNLLALCDAVETLVRSDWLKDCHPFACIDAMSEISNHLLNFDGNIPSIQNLIGVLKSQEHTLKKGPISPGCNSQPTENTIVRFNSEIGLAECVVNMFDLHNAKNEASQRRVLLAMERSTSLQELCTAYKVFEGMDTGDLREVGKDTNMTETSFTKKLTNEFLSVYLKFPPMLAREFRAWAINQNENAFQETWMKFNSILDLEDELTTALNKITGDSMQRTVTIFEKMAIVAPFEGLCIVINKILQNNDLLEVICECMKRVSDWPRRATDLDEVNLLQKSLQSVIFAVAETKSKAAEDLTSISNTLDAFLRHSLLYPHELVLCCVSPYLAFDIDCGDKHTLDIPLKILTLCLEFGKASSCGVQWVSHVRPLTLVADLCVLLESNSTSLTNKSLICEILEGLVGFINSTFETDTLSVWLSDMCHYVDWTVLLRLLPLFEKSGLRVPIPRNLSQACDLKGTHFVESWFAETSSPTNDLDDSLPPLLLAAKVSTSIAKTFLDIHTLRFTDMHVYFKHLLRVLRTSTQSECDILLSEAVCLRMVSVISDNHLDPLFPLQGETFYQEINPLISAALSDSNSSRAAIMYYFTLSYVIAIARIVLDPQSAVEVVQKVLPKFTAVSRALASLRPSESFDNYESVLGIGVVLFHQMCNLVSIFNIETMSLQSAQNQIELAVVENSAFLAKFSRLGQQLHILVFDLVGILMDSTMLCGASNSMRFMYINALLQTSLYLPVSVEREALQNQILKLSSSMI